MGVWEFESGGFEFKYPYGLFKSLQITINKKDKTIWSFKI